MTLQAKFSPKYGYWRFRIHKQQPPVARTDRWARMRRKVRRATIRAGPSDFRSARESKAEASRTVGAHGYPSASPSVSVDKTRAETPHE